jgi:hypothetical protein
VVYGVIFGAEMPKDDGVGFVLVVFGSDVNAISSMQVGCVKGLSVAGSVEGSSVRGKEINAVVTLPSEFGVIVGVLAEFLIYPKWLYRVVKREWHFICLYTAAEPIYFGGCGEVRKGTGADADELKLCSR